MQHFEAARCCVFLCALLHAAVAPAGEARCQPKGQQPEIDECARRNFQGADAELNIVYGRVMEAVTGDRRVALRKEHRAWLAQRDASCKSEVRASEGGSAWTLAFYSCLEASTRRRTEKVKAWFPLREHRKAP